MPTRPLAAWTVAVLVAALVLVVVRFGDDGSVSEAGARRCATRIAGRLGYAADSGTARPATRPRPGGGVDDVWETTTVSAGAVVVAIVRVADGRVLDVTAIPSTGGTGDLLTREDRLAAFEVTC